MDGKLNVFEAVARRMAWLGQRQQVLSHNISNADTPNFVPLDLKEASFAQSLNRFLEAPRPATTHNAHITTAADDKAGPWPEQKDRDVYEVTPSGNAVVLEEQLVKVSENQMSYLTMTNLYRKHLEMLRAAIGRPSG
jgi:flagellar basal-body rod protein FlgB